MKIKAGLWQKNHTAGLSAYRDKKVLINNTAMYNKFGNIRLSNVCRCKFTVQELNPHHSPSR
jgi:hypothetical protein